MGKLSSKKFVIGLSWVAVVLWMGVIFFMSAQVRDDSAQLSRGLTKTLLAIIQGIFPRMEIDVQTFHFVVRKTAHFGSYFILAVLGLNALRRSGLQGAKSLVFALVICVVYAAADEFHQTFVPGRVGDVVDVLIDSSGAVTGLVFYEIVGKLFFRRNRSDGSKAD